jgi:hypothetical protein
MEELAATASAIAEIASATLLVCMTGLPPVSGFAGAHALRVPRGRRDRKHGLAEKQLAASPEKRSCATTQRHRATTSQDNLLRIQALET